MANLIYEEYKLTYRVGPENVQRLESAKIKMASLLDEKHLKARYIFCMLNSLILFLASVAMEERVSRKELIDFLQGKLASCTLPAQISQGGVKDCWPV